MMERVAGELDRDSLGDEGRQGIGAFNDNDAEDDDDDGLGEGMSETTSDNFRLIPHCSSEWGFNGGNGRRSDDR
jgi:hypothetical protein